MHICKPKKCTKRLSFIFLCYFSLLVVLIYNDKRIFDEVNVLVGIYHQQYYGSLLKPTELENAFHLAEEYRRSPELKIILQWSPAFGAVDAIGDIKNGCVQTYDRSAISIADAVVFHFAETYDRKESLPISSRNAKQRWVWSCMEPPWNTRFVFQKTLTPLNGVFNWTMTYRTDSDIYSPYAAAPEKVNKTVKEFVNEKTADALGLWMVSNCRPTVRANLIQELQRFIRIDVMGKCNNKPLCRGECAQQTINRYKFYFSFENSQCKQYITEKFWTNGIVGGAVPVVWGASRSDYEKVSPHNSFIHVNDFPSVQKLAEYLLELDKDDTKYGEYLRWKSIPDSIDIPSINSQRKTHFNSLCEKLKTESPERTEIKQDLDTWWFGEGYTPKSKTFSICNHEDGPSGTPMRDYVTFGYSIALIILCIVTMKFGQYVGI